jgi:hypothetical protein
MDPPRPHTAHRELNPPQDPTEGDAPMGDSVEEDVPTEDPLVEDTRTEDPLVEDTLTGDLVEAVPEAVGAGDTRAGAKPFLARRGTCSSMAFVTSRSQVRRIHCFSNGARWECRGRLKLSRILRRDRGGHELHPYGQGGPSPGLLGA